MATRKKAPAAAPVDVPRVIAGDEGNKYLARVKAGLAKKWTLTKGDTLSDALCLAWYFVALGRSNEARELADHVADGVPYNADPKIWQPTASAIALAAWLAREADDGARRATLMARLVAHPAVTASPREAFLKFVAEANKDVRSAEVDPSQKHACQGFARGCARAAYVMETARENLYEEGSFDVEALEATVTEGLQGLRAHLAR